MQMTDVKQAVDALASTFEEFKSANNQALKEMADKGAVDTLTEAKLARLDDEIERLRDGLERTRASLNRPLGDAKSEAGAEAGPLARQYKAAFGQYLRRGDESGVNAMEIKALSVDADGVVQDLTVRSFGVVRATDTPPISVVIEPLKGVEIEAAGDGAAAQQGTGEPHPLFVAEGEDFQGEGQAFAAFMKRRHAGDRGDDAEHAGVPAEERRGGKEGRTRRPPDQ